MGDMQFDGTQEEWDALVKKNNGSKGSDERIVDTNKTINSQTEISDEEIEKQARQYTFDEYQKELDFEKYDTYNDFINGAKWYREQLKSKQ